ncbi:uncharacterized protein LOC115985431 [Quercus lobata]|uniref:uncharacterized protein LOC115985431 n=1 Tax=Quercus lobata TaxID=97700 RepID=UPI00124468B2|nr:uncharacterized protein LOC115985431 [Quercus lobata]
MQGWKAKLLSQAGKVVTIKVVIQSILAYSMSVFKVPAQEVIEKCAIWRVGSGHAIEDPGKLEELFYPWEAELVSRIQVGEGCTEDFLVWPLTADGAYSVWTPSSSTGTELQSVWKKIWKIQVPSKVRHFFWCASIDSLLTKQNLRARHVPIDETCDQCDEHQQTLLHCLWLCDQAQFVWKSDPAFVPLYQKLYRTFVDLFEEVLHQCSQFRVALFSTIVWRLWQRQNWLREKQPSCRLHELGNRAKDYVMEHLDANAQQSRVVPRRTPTRWSPPSQQNYRGNFDAGFFDALGYAGIGVVFCDHMGQIIAGSDHMGQIIAALSQRIPFVWSYH